MVTRARVPRAHLLFRPPTTLPSCRFLPQRGEQVSNTCSCSCSYLSYKDKWLTFGPPLALRQCLLLACVATYVGVESEAHGETDVGVDELARAMTAYFGEMPTACRAWLKAKAGGTEV